MPNKYPIKKGWDVPVSTKIIGANEHESHYVLDIVYNNSSDLKIKAVSGDMHSINRVNFSLMYLTSGRDPGKKGSCSNITHH